MNPASKDLCAMLAAAGLGLATKSPLAALAGAVIGGVLVVLGYTQGWFGKKKRR